MKSILLYGAETWKTTVVLSRRIQSFVNGCLCKILGVRWHEKILNDELWQCMGQLPPAMEVRKRNWGWIGHTLRKEEQNITRHALHWNPPGKRRHERPRNTWRCSWEAEMKEAGFDWHSMVRMSRDRRKWKELIGGLCSARSGQAYVKREHGQAFVLAQHPLFLSLATLVAVFQCYLLLTLLIVQRHFQGYLTFQAANQYFIAFARLCCQQSFFVEEKSFDIIWCN